MTCVMCSPWKRTFTLAPLAPLTMQNDVSFHLEVHVWFAITSKIMDLFPSSI